MNEWLDPLDNWSPDNCESVLIYTLSDGYLLAEYDGDRNEYVVRDLEGGFVTFLPEGIVGWSSISQIPVAMIERYKERQEIIRRQLHQVYVHKDGEQNADNQ